MQHFVSLPGTAILLPTLVNVDRLGETGLRSPQKHFRFSEFAFKIRVGPQKLTNVWRKIN